MGGATRDRQSRSTPDQTETHATFSAVRLRPTDERTVTSFHVKRSPRPKVKPPLRALYAFPDPVSPHLAARAAGARIDLGVVDRWVIENSATITVVETAGGLFSPLGFGTTNCELAQLLRPDMTIVVACDRLGVLHDLTTTLALAAARGLGPTGVVLSSPAVADTSTGRNAAELATLRIANPVAVFPRAEQGDVATAVAARTTIAWIADAVSRTER